MDYAVSYLNPYPQGQEDGKIGEISNNQEEFFRDVITMKSLLHYTSSFIEFTFENS